jgi:hypothetical protein
MMKQEPTRPPLLRAGEGATLSMSGNAIEIGTAGSKPIVARITGSYGTSKGGKTIYMWEEMTVSGTGQDYELKEFGIVGNGETNQAFEMNNLPAATGRIVRLRVRGAGSENRGQINYEFDLGGSGASSPSSVQCIGNVLYVTYE